MRRLEHKRLRAKRIALQFRAANRRRRARRSQVLRLQARLGPRRANVVKAQRSPGDGRQRQAGAQHLPAALTERAVNRNHRIVSVETTRRVVSTGRAQSL
jgi:hypothetical protein